MDEKIKSSLHKFLLKGASVATSLFVENHMLQISEYQIMSKEVPKAFDGYRIVQLSDLHSKCFGNDNERLIRKIHLANPDLVVMTGDMSTRNDRTHEVFYHLAETIGTIYPCYYVVGNHEQNMKKTELNKFFSHLSELGIHVMKNDRVEIQRDGESIDLYGLWFPLKYYREAKDAYHKEKFGGKDMKRAMGRVQDHYGILLTHNPLSFETYSDWGADLTLGGHVHGGMIRLPFIGGLLSPERQFFPKYSGGVYDRNGKKLVVSRGLGSGIFGARIFNCPEVVVITLYHDNTD